MRTLTRMTSSTTSLRDHRWKRPLAALGAAALTATLFNAAALPAQAADQTVTVDAATIIAPQYDGVGRGFLYGLSFDGSQPTDDLLLPLKPRSFRSGGEIDTTGSKGWLEGGETTFLPRYNAFKGQALRVTTPPYNAEMDMIVSDLWGSDGPASGNSSLLRPCDDGPACTEWRTFLQSLLTHLDADDLLNDRVRFDIWNEPGNNVGFWPRPIAQYYQMWDTAVEVIRAFYPQAVIVGPSTGNYSGSAQQQYLDHYVSAGTMPDVWNWHFSRDPVVDAADMRARLTAAGHPEVPLTMNEYLLDNGSGHEVQPAHLAWYLARLQQSGIVSASHAIWSGCCGSGLLDTALVNQAGVRKPAGEYWVYDYSAKATGSLLATDNHGGKVDLFATRDDAAQKLSILLGSRVTGSDTFSGALTVDVDGLDDMPAISSSGAVRALVQRIGTVGQLGEPLTVFNQLLPVVDGSIQLPVTWESVNDAYTVTLTPGRPDSASVDSSVTGSGLAQFQYGSGWTERTDVAGAYQDTVTTATGAADAVFTFEGSSAMLYTLKGADQGRFTVSLDGAPPTEVDGYAAGPASPQLAWSASGLDAGTHVLAIHASGTRNAQSSGTAVGIDRIDLPQSVTPVDTSNIGPATTHFTYSAGWTHSTDVAGMYLGTSDGASAGGSSASIQFTGRGLWLFGSKGPDQGVMTIKVDSGQAVSVDNYAPVASASTLLWGGALTPGAHTVTIAASGTSNPASSGTAITLDKADADVYVPLVYVDDNVTGTQLNRWQFNYAQGSNNNGGVATGVGDAYSGSVHWSGPRSGTPSAPFNQGTLRFEGSKVSVSVLKDTDQGVVGFSVDGGPVETFDAYGPRLAQTIVWSSATLPFGEHTLVVTSRGRPGGTSGGSVTALDYAVIDTTDAGVPTTKPTVEDVASAVAGNTAGNPIALDFSGDKVTSVAVETPPAHGTAVATGLGIAYTPAVGFVGVDSFRYTATNAAGVSEPATVTVSVTAPDGVSLPVSATVETRTLAGKVYLSVSAKNESSVPVTVVITTAFGSKTFSNVAPGATASVSINSRLTAIPAGEATAKVTGSVGGETVTNTVTAPYAAFSSAP